ncbi:MarR family winged helix-turn-helix transcriptional regulator [Candidatus Poriferisodalis sp.]|uniref:MarR family winged helix-turn-helix transcriptional regulator n=1 Tax=Candidatus Poriferisodalis sp. TaxID=3101277 RepID=UPI003B59A32F
MKDRELAEQVRAFNRVYTEAIGSLADRHEGLDVTLAQSRVLYTVNSLNGAQVNQIAERLDLDLAYTSRLLGTLEDEQLLQRTISSQDRRQRDVALTAKGSQLLDEIERRSNQRALDMVGHLTPRQVTRLIKAMDTIASLISRRESADGQPD